MATTTTRTRSRRKREVGTWRCSVCGSAENLYGCAVAIVFGRLEGADDIRPERIEPTELCSGSIECRIHQGTAEVERWDGRRWVRWHECEKCDGKGSTHAPWNVRETVTCGECNGHGGWWPGVDVQTGVSPVTWAHVAES